MFRLVALLLVCFVVSINGHGRLMKPPNRSSLWRFPEFANQNPPPNYTDNELFCGAIHQIEVVGGNCGVCGDPFSQATPRDNEIGGKWYRGIIGATYTSGQIIDIEVELTTAHLGYMEWRLCDNAGQSSSQSCYKYLLQKADGSGSKVPVTTAGPTTSWYKTQLRLPAGVKCSQCVIQWNYRAGNNWGQCDDGSNAPGCGPQETFRGCSDVRIN